MAGNSDGEVDEDPKLYRKTKTRRKQVDVWMVQTTDEEQMNKVS